jgi:hypothetical protein
MLFDDTILAQAENSSRPTIQRHHSDTCSVRSTTGARGLLTAGSANLNG